MLLRRMFKVGLISWVWLAKKLDRGHMEQKEQDIQEERLTTFLHSILMKGSLIHQLNTMDQRFTWITLTIEE